MLIDQKDSSGTTSYVHGFDRTYETDIFSPHLKHSTSLRQRDDNMNNAIGGSKPAWAEEDVGEDCIHLLRQSPPNHTRPWTHHKNNLKELRQNQNINQNKLMLPVANEPQTHGPGSEPDVCPWDRLINLARFRNR